MKSGFREFLKDTVKTLQGDQEKFSDHAMKVSARKLLKKDQAHRKAKRKAKKEARKR